MTTLAAAPARRARPLAPVRHSAVLAGRSLINTLRNPEALIDVTFQPMIFLALFTYVFGGAIAHGSTQDYLQFLLPGVLGQAIALAAVTIGVNLNDDVNRGIFDRFRSLPIARSAPLVGTVLADVVRYAVLTISSLGFGYAIGFRATTSVPEVLAACVLAVAFSLCLCWASVFVGMLARTSGSVQGIMFLLLLPLSFAGSTFVPASTLPGWLHSVSEVNPITNLVETLRALLIVGPVGTHLWWTLGWMAAFLVVFVPLALRAYARTV